MTKETMTTIEVNGVKMEVDLRHAKRVEEIRIGARVKLLNTGGYSGTKVHSGVVIGFEPFQSLPTIIVAYVEASFNDVDLKFAYINSKTENMELVVAIDDDHFDVSKHDIDGYFERAIEKHENEINELKAKQSYFHNKFKAFWEPLKTGEPA